MFAVPTWERLVIKRASDEAHFPPLNTHAYTGAHTCALGTVCLQSSLWFYLFFPQWKPITAFPISSLPFHLLSQMELNVANSFLLPSACVFTLDYTQKRRHYWMEVNVCLLQQDKPKIIRWELRDWHEEDKTYTPLCLIFPWINMTLLFGHQVKIVWGFSFRMVEANIVRNVCGWLRIINSCFKA